MSKLLDEVKRQLSLDEMFGFGKPSLASYYVLGHAHPEGLDYSSRGTYNVNLSSKNIQRTHKSIVKMMGKKTWKQTNDKMRSFSKFLNDRGHTPKSAFDLGVRHQKEMMGGKNDEMSDETKQDLGHQHYNIPQLASDYGIEAKRTA